MKVGDRVQLTKTYWGIPAGQKGTILSLEWNGRKCYQVRLDRKKKVILDHCQIKKINKMPFTNVFK